jgi:hypothetical protein
LDKGLSLWRDPGGRITPSDIERLPPGAFTPLSSFSLGFTTDAIWLKFSVRRDAQAPSVWWLELRQPLLEDVQLFVAEPSGSLREISPISPTGSEMPASPLGQTALAQTDAVAPADELRPPRYRRALFAVIMPGEQVQTFYLRVQSQTAMSSSVYLWRPEALLKYSGNETFFWGSVFGAYALVILFYGAFWLWTRERVHGIYTLYVLVNFLAAFFTGNWPAQLFPTADPHWLVGQRVVEQPERRECAQPDQRAAVGNHRLGTEWASRHVEEEEEDHTEEAEWLARVDARDHGLAHPGAAAL